MKKRIFALLLLTVLLSALLSAGCGSAQNDEIDAENGESGQIYIVGLCYVNREFLLSGNEELPPVYFYEDQHIIAGEGDQYRMLLDETLRGIYVGVEGLETMVTDKVQFNSVTADGGQVIVDMKGEGLSGSSLEEGLLISQIVNSLLGSFEEIGEVQFMVDGEITESLMGHYDAESPYEEGIYPLPR